jgi:hypothetical protein
LLLPCGLFALRGPFLLDAMSPRLLSSSNLDAARLCRLSACLLMAGLAGVAHAQAMGSGDANEWSGFGAPVAVPERPGSLPDAVFQQVKHDGPWSVRAEVALSQDALQLRELLLGARWAEAMVLLKQGQPDLNRRDETTLTPLSLAARAGQTELVREMLRQGADPDQVGASGMTPLGAAAWAGHELVVRDLLRQGARVDVPGRTGQLPLHLACAAGQVRTMALLMKQGADWREPNRQGRHALDEAALFGQIGAMQALLDAGAPLAEPDLHQLNAVHAAALGEQREALAWLRGRGVPVPSVLSQVLIDQLNVPPQP